MSTHRLIDKICIIITVCSILITIIFMHGQSFGMEVVVDEDAEINSDSEWFTNNDQKGNWESEQTTDIVLSDSGISIDGGGAYTAGSDVYITNGGYYEISGALNNGRIIVNAYDSSKVWIRLNNAGLKCESDACIRVESADKVFLTLAEGSVNSLVSGGQYSDEAVSDSTGGVIYAHDDLTINGSGSLTIEAGYKHGIEANDDLVITGGNISIEAEGDGIHVNDSFRLKEASLIIKSGDEGIAVCKEGGYFYQESGKIDIECEDDGINAEGDFTFAGGELNISAKDDGIHSDTAVSISGGTIKLSECYEGIEALTIDISGGDITIYPSDDGLNANGGSADMFGGPGGGMGGPMMGNNNRDSLSGNGLQDDRMQEAGPATGDNNADNGGRGAENENAAEDSSDEETWIHISGGSLTIINENARDADGLDSNGDIVISGGTVRVSLSGDGSNNSIDYGSESGGKAIINGGTLIGGGGGAMLESMDSSSTQASLIYVFSETVEAGTEVTLKDDEGQVLLNYVMPCRFSALTLSSPELAAGETYYLEYGSETVEIVMEEAQTMAGNVQNGGMGGHGGFGRMGGRGLSENGLRRNGLSENGMGDFGGMGGFPPGMGKDPTNMDEGTNDADAESTDGNPVVSPEIWGLITVSILLLCTAVLMVGRYKRK